MVPRELLSGPHFIMQARAGHSHIVTLASEDVTETANRLRFLAGGAFDNEKAKLIVDWRSEPPFLLTHLQNEAHFQMSLKKASLCGVVRGVPFTH